MINKFKEILNTINDSEIVMGLKKYFINHNEIEIANKMAIGTLIIIISFITYNLR